MLTAITGKTAILLMLADPVSHIRGSALINSSFKEMNLDAAISPIHVLPEDVPFCLDAIRRMRNVAGLGITIPHKIPVYSLVDEVTEAAQRMGAVNFVRRNSDGTLVGHNIDGEGFIRGLKAHEFAPVGKKVLVVGAGGVGRAIALALTEAGVSSLSIANRTFAKAEALAREGAAIAPACNSKAVDLDDPAALEDIDLLVNATSLGMHEGDPLPLAVDGLSAATTVAEVIISPAMTPLLQAAQDRGCITIPGDAMLKPQPQLVAQFLGLRPRAE
ncbi:shikimate dehydrogenase [Microvirga lupini]|uniref:shikimate dehydrogenase (NADP(+)) n=1 Tax=Microvirga lupini TaxID=420324 RepID=A0A7W4VQ71_9HYPH|nr:shikimate dehydrogenase [Microvirga lupini]MBB3021318.1 shikimate dehydrogenase [Microvirga lupini]